MSLIVKICGLSTPETLEAALQAGADMVGFVSFAPSPRHVEPAAMAKLARIARGRADVAVLTVDADDSSLDTLVAKAAPGWLQLHGSETPERVRTLRQRFGIPVMKALPIASRADLAAIPDYAGVADRLLFDARAPKQATRPGGLGVPFDWHLLEHIDRQIPFMVSGGLDAGNVAEALAVTGADGVDVSSGVERAPGIKDADMIRAFIRAARAAHSVSAL
jgi:phosphoribosylanthranilate isomerase